jgi:hypothetical protein
MVILLLPLRDGTNTFLFAYALCRDIILYIGPEKEAQASIIESSVYRPRIIQVPVGVMLVLTVNI